MFKLNISIRALTLVLALTLSPCLIAGSPTRVVALGGPVTEIIYALGEEKKLVGNDSSSIFPEAAVDLPRVGYYRNIPLEGVISLRPDLVLASEQAGPLNTLKRLRQLGISVTVLSDQPSLDSLYLRIHQIATALKVPDKGSELVQKVQKNIKASLAQSKKTYACEQKPSAIFVMKHSSQLMAAGAQTSPSVLMRLAGINNLMTSINGYKPVSAEAIALMNPDLILTTQSSIDKLGSLKAFMRSTGVSLTQAAQNNRVIVIEDLLILSMGPRTNLALEQLAKARNSSGNQK